jgi:hypothetical protein
MTFTKEIQMTQTVPEPCLYAAASLLIAETVTHLETNQERKEKMVHVQDKKRAALVDAFRDVVGTLSLHGDAWEILQRIPWDREHGMRLLIDLSFTNPFSPHEFEYDDDHMIHALEKVASWVGLRKGVVKEIWKTRKDAIKAHKHVSWGNVFLFGTGGLVVLAIGGWVAAPLIGGALGAGAGLAGAAATAHGLALLGGGSLALGGLGMTGGMWLVTGVAGGLGLTAAGGGALLLDMGSHSARAEILKMQVSYKEICLAGQVDRAVAINAIKKLEEERMVITKQLEEERCLNDKNSARLKDIEATLKAVEDGLAWMRSQKAA